MLFHILRLLEEQRQVHLQVCLVHYLKGQWYAKCQWQRWSIWPAGADISWHVFSLLFGTYMYYTRKDKTWIVIMIYNYDIDTQGHNSMRDLTLDKQPASMSLEVIKRNIPIPNSDSERVGGKVHKLLKFFLIHCIVVFIFLETISTQLGLSRPYSLVVVVVAVAVKKRKNHH